MEKPKIKVLWKTKEFHDLNKQFQKESNVRMISNLYGYCKTLKTLKTPYL